MTDAKLVYFAGKVDSYRSKLFKTNRVMSEPVETEVQTRSGGRVLYGGPNALSCDHQCWHSKPHGLVDPNGEHPKSHNWGWEDTLMTPCPGSGTGVKPAFAVERCLDQIRDCHAVHAYIDSTDCIGTLSELGFASALKKPIYLVFDSTLIAAVPYLDDFSHPESWKRDRDEFWFVKRLPGVVSVLYGGPTTIHSDLLA
jgi:hypothetical protein